MPGDSSMKRVKKKIQGQFQYIFGRHWFRPLIFVANGAGCRETSVHGTGSEKVEHRGDRRYFENLDRSSVDSRGVEETPRWKPRCPLECFRKAGVEPLEKQTAN